MTSDLRSSSLFSRDGLTRWYIDVRGLTASTSQLPLLSTLQPSDQATVQKFYHLSDRHMSLASYMLKYLFIHQTCRVPWKEVVISRTPAPHKRPCYIPVPRGADESTVDDAPGTRDIEFNVSHQAGMVALVGCIVPSGVSTSASETLPAATSRTISTPQTGVDITCVDERERRKKDSTPKTEAELDSFIDIFSEVFSARELRDMKAIPGSASSSLEQSIAYRLRLFYTYWALKEAYIKMTGEALLAPWLRELEFIDVVPPEPPSPGSTGHAIFGQPQTSIKILLHGREVHDVRMEVVGFGEEYMFATATKGNGVGPRVSPIVRSEDPKSDEEPMDNTDHGWSSFQPIDIEADIAPCATGACTCLLS